jgi:electron transfer flavoprotein beta subunit
VKILIAIKQAIALDEDFEIRADGRDIEEDFFLPDLNEWDEYSLEEAMLIKERHADTPVEVVCVTIAPDSADEALRKCLAKGADRAIRVWDESMEGSDPVAIARALAAVAKKEAPDLFFAGVQSSDHAHGATGIAVAGFLGWAHSAVVARLDYTPGAKEVALKRELEGGLSQELRLPCPAVLTIQLGINKPRYASLRGMKLAAAKPIETLAPGDIGLATNDCGESGSLARVRRMYVPEKQRAQILAGDVAAQAKALAAIIREATGS